MNSTPAYGNVTLNYQDRFFRAVAMNTTVVILGLIINYINAAMINTFSKYDRSNDVLYTVTLPQILKLNPRYILFIHLVLNDLLLLTTSTAIFLFTSFHRLQISACFFFLLPTILTSQNNPLNLAFMAAECYISVCVPLRYENICSVKRTYIVIGVIWGISFLSVLPDVVLLATEPVEFFNSRVLCIRDNVFRSSYSIKKRDASHILFLVFVWLTLFYTYFRILFAAKAADSNAKKARNTLLIHGVQLLLCMMVYVQPLLLQIFLYLFPGGPVIFVSFIIIQILPRFLSPIIYGLRDKTFKKYFIKTVMCRISINIHPNKQKNVLS